MLTSRAWIITSGMVGAISLMLRSVFNFSITGPNFSLPLSPIFIINGIILAVAASSSLFGHESDSSASENHHDDHYDQYEHADHHHHHHDYNHNHDHDRSSKNSSDDSSFNQYNNKVHESSVRSETSTGSYGVSPPVSSPEVQIPQVAPEKPSGLRRPPTAPLKTFPQDEISGDESETMEEMWKRVKAERLPTTPKRRQPPIIPRNESRMSTSSCPSPSRARPSPSRAKRPPLSQASPGPSRPRMIERIPTWVKLKKELSMGRDELNSRVEAFIKKFNDEMKLQRLESLSRRYKLFRRSSDDK